MESLRITINIQADSAKIWSVLWNDATYRIWTSVFFEGSHAAADNWEEGSTVQFLNPQKNGMYSLIHQHIPNELMVFKHIGYVKEGENLPLDEETKKWSGLLESYSLTEMGDTCQLAIEMDTDSAHMESTQKTFMRAFEKVKELSEN